MLCRSWWDVGSAGAGWAGLELRMGASAAMRATAALVMVWMEVGGSSGWPRLELGTEWVRRYCHRECRGDLDESHVEKVMLAAAEDAKQHDRR